MEYGLYVPRADARHDIAKGSAIVGERLEDGWVETHYEGGLFTPMTFEEKIQHAAGRRHERYPTTALRAWPESDLICVGKVQKSEKLNGWIISEITDAKALTEWNPEDHVVGGSPEMRSKAAGRLWSRLSSNRQMEVSRRISAGHDATDAILGEQE